MSRSTTTSILKGFAAAADLISNTAHVDGNTALYAGAGAAGVLLREVAALLEDRTPEEAVAILISLRDHGVKALSQDELDAQVAASLAKLKPPGV